MQLEGEMLEETARMRLNEPVGALRCLEDISLFADLIHRCTCSCNSEWKSQLGLKTCSYSKYNH